MKSTNVLDEISSTSILQVQETTNRKFQTFLILYSGLRLEARRVGIRESESRTQEKKKDMETRDRKIFVEISRDLFEPRERDWILLPRGRKLAPSRFTPLYGKFEPLVSPTVRKHPPMMHPSSNFRWKFHRNLYPISALSFPLFPPSIHLCISIRCSLCHRSFVRQRVNLSRVKWKGGKKRISHPLWESTFSTLPFPSFIRDFLSNNFELYVECVKTFS